MKLELAASCAVVFGSLYTIFRKYQFVVDLEGTQKQFNQPMLQAFFIFVGMTSIYFFRPFIPKQQSQPNKKQQSKFIYFLPSLLDVIGTILDTTGLFYTSVSVSQMLKGSTLFFTYVITVIFGSKKLTKFQHFWMLSIVFSLALIGYSNSSSAHQRYEANPLLGNFLIILSQLIFALMFLSEQKITRNYNIQVSNAVLWQGLWGVAISTGFLLIFSQIKTEIIQCDVFQSCSLMMNNWKLFASVIVTALCIAPFNYFGLMITKNTSALQRCLVCTSRMIVVWIVSLFFSWESFSLIQLIGYLLLTYAIYQFNQCQKGKKPEQLTEQEQPIREQKSNQVNQKLQVENIEKIKEEFIQKPCLSSK